MMKLCDLMDLLERHSPQEAACDWDNVGLLVGDASWDVRRVYVALDATDEVIDHAICAGCDVIVTHHPMIFSGMKRVEASDFTGRRVMRLLEHHMALFAMHTNFDIYGMAELAADRIGLVDSVPLEETGEDAGVPVGIGRVGTAHKRMSAGDYAAYIREIFGLSHVRLFGDAAKEVRRVAICPGSGGSDIAEAIAKGADCYVTGDIDHHSGIDAVMQQLVIIDAGHYGIEHIFIDYMADYIAAHTKDIAVQKEPFREPFCIIT